MRGWMKSRVHTQIRRDRVRCRVVDCKDEKEAVRNVSSSFKSVDLDLSHHSHFSRGLSHIIYATNEDKLCY